MRGCGTCPAPADDCGRRPAEGYPSVADLSCGDPLGRAGWRRSRGDPMRTSGIPIGQPSTVIAERLFCCGGRNNFEQLLGAEIFGPDLGRGLPRLANDRQSQISAEFGPNLEQNPTRSANARNIRPNLPKFWPNSTNMRPMARYPDRIWPTSGQHRRKLGQHIPICVEIGHVWPKLANLGPNLAHTGRCWPNLGRRSRLLESLFNKKWARKAGTKTILRSWSRVGTPEFRRCTPISRSVTNATISRARAPTTNSSAACAD